MDKNTSLGERVGEERRRLGKTQEELASACHTSRKTMGNIEGGKNAPGAEILSAMAQLGADVQYILTGTRSENLYKVAEEQGEYKVKPDLARTREVDPGVLQGVIAGVKEYLNESGIKMSAAKETELVMLLLDFMNAENVQDKSAVREMVSKVIEFKYKRR